MQLFSMSTQHSALVRFLRWLEQFAKTDMVYLAHGGSWLLFGNIAVTALSFVVLYAFANFIPQETYGQYRFILSVFEVLYITTLSGLGTSLTQAVASGNDGSLKDIIRTRLLHGLIGAALSAGIGLYYLISGNLLLGLAFLLFAPTIPLFPTSQIYASYLLGKKNFRLQSLLNISVRVLTAVPLLLVLYFSSSLLAILAVFFVSNICANALLSWYALIKEPPNRLRSQTSIRFGKHLSAIEALSAVSANVDKFLIWKLLGSAPLASFLIAYAIPQELIARVVGIFTMLAFPKFGESKTIRSIDIFWKLIRMAILMAVPVAAYIAVAPWLFEVFFPQYVSMVLYAQALSLVLILAPFGIITTYFAARQMTQALYIASIGDFVIRTATFLPLVYFFGLLGAIVATLISFAMRSIFLVYLLFHTVSK